MKPLTILVDLDGIAADFLAHWLDLINQKYPHLQLKTEDVTTWDVVDIPKMAKLTEREKDKLYSLIHGEHFFWDLKPIDGAANALKALKAEGHEVYFLSTAAGPYSAKEKFQWVDKYFPFIGHSNITLTKHKINFKGDVLIDDKPSTLENYVKTWPGSLALTIKYPYNAHLEGNEKIVVAGHYTNTDEAWGNILYAIRQKAKNEDAISNSGRPVPTPSGPPNCS